MNEDVLVLVGILASSISTLGLIAKNFTQWFCSLIATVQYGYRTTTEEGTFSAQKIRTEMSCSELLSFCQETRWYAMCTRCMYVYRQVW